ncbi:uncharacterized protein [Montipora foliosa]|uniref:uncharacterized protein n=1 Tax=Montipora foliosa TaxID=591990 RepID=UPI0035F1E49C
MYSISVKVQQHTVVCSLHFKDNDLERSGFSGRWYLKPGTVPSVFQCWEHKPYLTSKPPKERKLNKFQLRSSEVSCRKRKTSDESLTAFEAEPIEDCVDSTVAAIDGMKETETELAELKAHILSLTEKLKTGNTKIEQLEQTVREMEFCIENIEDADICFYTGFRNRQVYNAVLTYVNPGANSENLVVRIGLFERDLAYRFNISIGTVSNIVISWANFLYLRLGSLSIWPSKEVILEKMPESFKSKYKETRVIIDCTEIKVEMPSSLVLKSQTYSNYKSANTLKGLVGISPSGSITFLSQLYTGSISDREITERCGILNMPFQAGDSLMADKGFDIQDLLDPIGVTLNIPPFLQMQDQMPANDVLQTQQIAAERIHVERTINKIKNFHIFDQIIPISLAGSINQIWTVCGLLTLFQNPIIS